MVYLRENFRHYYYYNMKIVHIGTTATKKEEKNLTREKT